MTLILIGCFHFRRGEELTKFKRFQYFHQNLFDKRYFAVMFTQSDTFYLKKYSLTNRDTLSYALLPSSERTYINKFVKTMDTFASAFSYDSLIDLKNNSERIVFDLNFTDETISVYCQSFQPPLAITEFTSWVNSLKSHMNFIPIDSVIGFNDSANHKDIQKYSR
jgi:hypothetical protein